MKHHSIFYTAALTVTGVGIMTASLVCAAPVDHEFPLSVAEIQGRGASVFAEADGNGDGLISIEEFTTARAESEMSGRWHGPGENRFRHQRDADSRGDHADRHADMRADMHADMEDEMFTQLDANEDGVLSRDEFRRDNHEEARKALMMRRMFSHLDQNDDGVLTPEEFPGQRLLNLDADGDGEITREELHRGRRDNRHRAG